MLETLDNLAMGLDPSLLMSAMGLEPDDWQQTVLRSQDPRLLMLCCRQSGKSSSTAALALHTGLFQQDALVLLFSPSLRQSSELFQKILAGYQASGRIVPSRYETQTALGLENGSRIISLPGSPATVRGYSGPKLVIVDEAAMIADELFVAVTPMLAVSQGRLVLLSTPLGKRGVFYDLWENGDPEWRRIKVRAQDCPRIPSEWLAQQRQLLGDRHYRQEYECSFEDVLDQIFSTESINAAFDSDLPPLFGDDNPCQIS